MRDGLKGPPTGSGRTTGSGFFNEQRFLVYGSTATASYAIGLAWVMIRHELWSNPEGKSCIDFTWIWMISKFALSNALAQAYNFSVFSASRAVLAGPPNCLLEHFDYPPTLAFFTYPLGLMPFSVAFAVWMVATLLIYLAAVYAIIPRPAAVIAALTPFPVVFNVLRGHNGFLTAGLIGLSLVFMERRPWLSGFFIGLLTYKPQFGILFPPALLASRNWRVLLSAGATSVIFAAAAAVAFGYHAWPSFVAALADRASSISKAPAEATPLVSVFGFLRSAGVSAHLSWTVQLAVTGIVAVTVCGLWARPIAHSLKAAALAIGAVLASPHAYGYDVCILTIAVAFLVKDGLANGFLRGERTAVLICWFSLILLTGPVPAIICVALLVIVVRRAFRSRFAARKPVLDPQPVVAGDRHSPCRFTS